MLRIMPAEIKPQKKASSRMRKVFTYVFHFNKIESGTFPVHEE